MAFLLVGTVSAMDWDNIEEFKTPEESLTDYGVYEIYNSFLIPKVVKGDKIADVELISNTDYCIENCEAVLKVTTHEDTTNLFNEIEIWNLAKTKEEDIEEKNVLIRGATYTTEKDIYNVTCTGEKVIGEVQKDCTRKVIGTEEVINYYWNTYNGELLTTGENYFKITGKKNEKQSVDWIADMLGIKTTDWAVWTSGLNVDLIAYYNCSSELESVSGGSLDIDGGTGGYTSTNAFPIDDGMSCTDDLWITQNDPFRFLNDTWSIAGWLYFEGTDAGPVFGARVGTDGWNIIKRSTYIEGTYIDDSGTGSPVTNGLVPATWYHFVITSNSSHACFWINGSLEDCGVSTTRTDVNQRFTWGQDWDGTAALDMMFDEFAFYYRDLNPSEISDLYNDGTGISYGPAGNLKTTLNSPINDTSTNNASIDFKADLTPYSGYNITNATVEVYYSNGTTWKTNYTAIGNGSAINLTRSISGWSGGTYYWNVYGCTEDESTGTFENCSYATNNYTLTWLPFTTEEENHTAIVRETDYSTFYANITTSVGYTVQSGRLVYNNSQYSAAEKIEVDSDTEQLVQSIYIPQGILGFVNESRDFYWNVSVTNEANGVTASFTTDTYNQTVSELPFGLCSIDYTVPVLNFTLIDETNNIIINATSNATTFQATFDYGTSSGNLMKNYSMDNLTVGNNTFDFCTANYTKPFKTNAEIFYTAADYVNKDYYLNNATLTNTTNSINLYLLPETEALEFFISVTQDLDALVGATVTISKYFVGEGVYKTVEIDTTDDDGQITAYLDLDKKYRFTITSGSTVLGVQDKDATCEAAPCEILLELTGEGSNMFDALDNNFALNIAHNLSFNQNNKMVTWDFIDTTGLATYFRMYIYRSYSNQSSTLIYDKTLYTSSGQITYNASAYTSGDFRVEVYVSRSPEKFIDFITFLLNANAEELGVIGLLAGFMFMMVIIFGLSMKPSILVFSVPLGLSLIKLMGLFSLSTTSLAVLWLLALVAVWVMNK